MNERQNVTRCASTVNIFTEKELSLLSVLARKRVFEVCLAADNGHIGASTAAAELFTVLYFGGVLRFNPANPNDPTRDRVLVRGHLGPLRYPLFVWLGWLQESELSSYRRIGSRLHGHEDHLATPGVDISPSGSLGMLLSYGVGAALSARDTGSNSRTFVFLGDGEEEEGVVSEAARHAAHLKLGNLIAIIDQNGKQLSNPVADTDSANLKKMWEGYGWKVICLENGNSVQDVLSTYRLAEKNIATMGQPVVILARTTKGIGLEGAEIHYSGYHTMSRVSVETVRDGITAIELGLDSNDVDQALSKFDSLKTAEVPNQEEVVWKAVALDIKTTNKTVNHPDDCQFAYFSELHKLVEQGVLDASSMYFLTADVTTKEVVAKLGFSKMFHFYNVGIREQHMIAMAHGITVVRPEARVLVNSFDAFTYRCIDQIHAALQGYGNIVILGDVSGITNSRNGKSHQTTGLPAALLSMEGLTFLEPWDATDTFACLNWALGSSRRVVYIRIHSSMVHCEPDESCVRTLGYYVVKDSAQEADIVLVGSGLTVDSCIQAADKLISEGLSVRVINVINPNSLDASFGHLVPNNKPVLTVYNGHPRILRQSVADALLQFSVHPSKLYGTGFSNGNTGTFREMLLWAELDGESVYKTAKSIL